MNSSGFFPFNLETMTAKSVLDIAISRTLLSQRMKQFFGNQKSISAEQSCAVMLAGTP